MLNYMHVSPFAWKTQDPNGLMVVMYYILTRTMTSFIVNLRCIMS